MRVQVDLGIWRSQGNPACRNLLAQSQERLPALDGIETVELLFQRLAHRTVQETISGIESKLLLQPRTLVAREQFHVLLPPGCAGVEDQTHEGGML